MSDKYKTDYLRIPEDYQIWDNFVNESPQGSIFCKSWWLETVSGGAFDLLVLTKKGVLKAGIPFCYKDSERYQIGVRVFTPYYGLMLSPTEKQGYTAALSEDMDLQRKIIREFPTNVNINIAMHHDYTNWFPFYLSGYRQTTNYTYINKDIKSIENVWDNLRVNIRTDIKKAERNGLLFREVSSTDELWDLTVKTFDRQGLKTPLTKSLHDDLIRVTRDRDSGAVYLVCDEKGTVYSGAFVVWDSDSAYIVSSAADPNLRNVDVTSFMYRNVLKTVSQRVDKLNFCGSMIPGVERLNRAFGGIQTPYLRIHKTGRPKAKSLAPWLNWARHKVSVLKRM